MWHRKIVCTNNKINKFNSHTLHIEHISFLLSFFHSFVVPIVNVLNHSKNASNQIWSFTSSKSHFHEDFFRLQISFSHSFDSISISFGSFISKIFLLQKKTQNKHSFFVFLVNPILIDLLNLKITVFLSYCCVAQFIRLLLFRFKKAEVFFGNWLAVLFRHMENCATYFDR